MKRRSIAWKNYFPMSWKSWGIFLTAMALASLMCVLLKTTTTSDTHVPLIFVLAVLVISLLTEGYFYGLMAAIASVFAVNWAFTYPYMKLDFTIYGYPLTFMTMLAVGFGVSTLTSRVQAQEKMRTEAEREKVRANLLRAVSHDLRTPLTAISGSLGVVLDSGEQLDSSEARQLLRDAKKDAEWLCSMVENLLSITRMSGSEPGRLTVQGEFVEEIISETVTNFKKRNPDINIHVSVPDEPVFAMMDAMLIEQVLYTLLDNAVIHGHGTDLIRITVESDGKQVAVTVSDNGRGIDDALLPSLFEGTHRLSGVSERDSSRCMGIGLSVCSTIIYAHDGSISARNLPEGGAQLRFTLPAAELDNMEEYEQ